MTTTDTNIAPQPTSVFGDHPCWARYQATLHFTGKLVGGCPSDPKLVEGWLAKNLGITDEEQLRQWTAKHLADLGHDPLTVTEDELGAAVEANAAEKQAQGFKTLDSRPYIEGRQIKAMLREATNISFPYPEKWCREPKPGGKGLSAGKTPIDTVRERVHVPEQPVIVADEIGGVDLAIGHLKDFRGNTRSTIGYFEYVEQPIISFDVHVLDDYISESAWARIWTVAEFNGLGARRSQGSGQFKVVGWEQTD